MIFRLTKIHSLSSASLPKNVPAGQTKSARITQMVQFFEGFSDNNKPRSSKKLELAGQAPTPSSPISGDFSAPREAKLTPETISSDPKHDLTLSDTSTSLHREGGGTAAQWRGAAVFGSDGAPKWPFWAIRAIFGLDFCF